MYSKRIAPPSLLRGLVAPLFKPRTLFSAIVILLLEVPLAVYFPIWFLLLQSAVSIYLFERTADGSDDLTHWPEIDLLDSIIYYFWFAYVCFMATLPGWLLAMVCRPFIPSMEIVGVLVFLFGSISYLVFAPFLFLSGLNNESPYNLFSPLIWKSLREMSQEWMLFYLVSLLFWLIQIGMTIICIVIFWKMKDSFYSLFYLDIIKGICVTFFIINTLAYFRLLGCHARILTGWLREQED